MQLDGSHGLLSLPRSTLDPTLNCDRRWEGGAGIDFKLHGFSHKLPALARFVFASLAGLAPQPDAFARVKEALLRNVGAHRGRVVWVGGPRAWR